MKPDRRPNKYIILLLGYVLAWGTYFGIRVCQRLTMETANAEVRAVGWGQFKFGNPRRAGDYHGTYVAPETHFFYKASATDTGRWYIVRPESLSFATWKPGDKTQVIFPHGRPLSANIYSPGEFWFTVPYMVLLLAISLFWSIGFAVVVFKPWRR